MLHNSYLQRRAKVLERMATNSALLLFGSSFAIKQEASNAIGADHKQNSDFYYLSGFNEKNSALLLINRGEKNRKQFIFCQPPDNFNKLWTGTLSDPKKAARQLGFDKGLLVNEFAQTLGELLKGLSKIYYPIYDPVHYQGGQNSALNESINQILCRLNTASIRRGIITPQQIINSGEILAPLRLIKSKDEISTITKSAQISVGGHRRLLDKLPTFNYEYQAEAELVFHYRRHNGEHAFPPIVAGGARSCILHYTDNNMPLRKEDSLLVDSGAQFNHYAADMTRTHPPRSSKNIQAFNRVYKAVLKTQKLVCKSATAGKKFEVLHKTAVHNLIKELIIMGILKGDAKKCLADGTYKKYFPHLTSHWIGLDVHDVGGYADQNLQEGMVFSVEPGLYFAKDDESVAHQWRGIGVRIEDTLAITEKGADNLTCDMPYYSAE